MITSRFTGGLGFGTWPEPTCSYLNKRDKYAQYIIGRDLVTVRPDSDAHQILVAQQPAPIQFHNDSMSWELGGHWSYSNPQNPYDGIPIDPYFVYAQTPGYGGMWYEPSSPTGRPFANTNQDSTYGFGAGYAFLGPLYYDPTRTAWQVQPYGIGMRNPSDTFMADPARAFPNEWGGGLICSGSPAYGSGGSGGEARLYVNMAARISDKINAFSQPHLTGGIARLDNMPEWQTPVRTDHGLTGQVTRLHGWAIILCGSDGNWWLIFPDIYVSQDGDGHYTGIRVFADRKGAHAWKHLGLFSWTPSGNCMVFDWNGGIAAIALVSGTYTYPSGSTTSQSGFLVIQDSAPFDDLGKAYNAKNGLYANASPLVAQAQQVQHRAKLWERGATFW